MRKCLLNCCIIAISVFLISACEDTRVTKADIKDLCHVMVGLGYTYAKAGLTKEELHIKLDEIFRETWGELKDETGTGKLIFYGPPTLTISPYKRD